MNKTYISLEEEFEAKEKGAYFVYYYINEDGEKLGGFDKIKIKAVAGDNDLHVELHEEFSGYLLGPEFNKDKPEIIKEGLFTFKKLMEKLSNIKEPLVYHFETSDVHALNKKAPEQLGHNGSLNKEKAEKMANGKKVHTTPLSDYKGHLMGKEYNDKRVEEPKNINYNLGFQKR
ncbi:MAG: hypothetical protein PHG08_00150 [Bacilli bacterium]|nr:hypothetical protein [Bacilli bacterium]